MPYRCNSTDSWETFCTWIADYGLTSGLSVDLSGFSIRTEPGREAPFSAKFFGPGGEATWREGYGLLFSPDDEGPWREGEQKILFLRKARGKVKTMKLLGPEQARWTLYLEVL